MSENVMLQKMKMCDDKSITVVLYICVKDADGEYEGVVIRHRH